MSYETRQRLEQVIQLSSVYSSFGTGGTEMLIVILKIWCFFSFDTSFEFQNFQTTN